MYKILYNEEKIYFDGKKVNIETEYEERVAIANKKKIKNLIRYIS